MAQDTTRGARSLMEAVAEVAPDLESRRVSKESTPKGAPPLPGQAATAQPVAALPTDSAVQPLGAPSLGVQAVSAPVPSANHATGAARLGPTLPTIPAPMAPQAKPAWPAISPPGTAKPPEPVPAASQAPEPPVTAPFAKVTEAPKPPTSSGGLQAKLAAAPAVPPRPSEATVPPAAPLPGPAQADTQIKRRAAGPSRTTTIAANDDAPTIGGLIYALNQKPSRRIYVIAAALSGLWLVMGAILSALMIVPEWGKGAGLAELFAKPVVLISLATVALPIGMFWVIAWLVYQAQDLRLRSSAMTEVAIRLAEPDRQAEEAVASLGQTVRRQVSYMNDAVSQAINRAGELEAMVHNEVSSLEQAFAANEVRMRGLLSEFANQRNELTGTGEHIQRTLRAIGSEVPQLLESLQSQQERLARLVGDAGQNLIALDTSLTRASGQLETSLDTRTTALRTVLTETTDNVHGMLGHATETLQSTLSQSTSQIHGMLTDTTDTVAKALTNTTVGMRDMLGQSSEQVNKLLVDRTSHLQAVLDEYTSAMHATLGARTGEFQTVFETFTKAIDQTLATRGDAMSAALVGQTEAFDQRLLERTRVIDAAFATRLQAFDESIRASTQTIDSTVGEKARLLAVAMDAHAKNLTETLSRQSQNLDEQLVQGIASVRRTSENITRQSVKAIEGLSGQADMLKTVSENLLTQIGGVTNRFENQSQSILRAANALESANHRIDSTLQNRHRELTDTLGRVTESTDQLGKQMGTYKSTIEASLTDAAQKTRALTDDLTRSTQNHAQTALNDLQRLRSDTEQQATRALDGLRDQFSTASQEMNQQVGTLSSRITETTDEIRMRTRTAAEELARDQEALRQQAQALPDATRQSTDAMRRVLAEQLRALDEVARIADREKRQMDIAPPVAAPPPRAALPSALSLTATLAAQPPAAPHPAPPARPAMPTPPSASNWSLGDLLSRASKPESPAVLPEPVHAPPPGGVINLEQMAAALDVPTAGAIWARFRSGQRGILVRSIYSADGRAVFDEANRRYQTDMPFRAMVDRFLADFEREVREVEARDAGALQAHLVSNSGRVYLFLAHASGRIN